MKVRRVELLEVDKDMSYIRIVSDDFVYELWCKVCQDGRVLDAKGKLLFRLNKHLAKTFLDMIDKELSRRCRHHAVGV